MSSKLAVHLLDVLRSAGVRTEEAGTFLLQLAAWEKREREGKLPAHLAMLQQDGTPYIKRHIEDALHFLAREPISAESEVAFAMPSQVLEFLSNQELVALVHALHAAHGQLNYEEMVEVCTRADASHNLYHLIPGEVAQLMTGLAHIDASDSVYCPFEGAYRLAQYANRITRAVYLEAKTVSPLPGLINALLDGSVQAHFSDPIRDPTWLDTKGNLRLFDVAVACPPFYGRQKHEYFYDRYGRFPESAYYGEVLHVRHTLAQTKRRAVIVVPNGILFRTAAGERQFKKDLLYSGQIKAVINLPPSLLTTTNLPFSLLVLSKERRFHSVLFVDASAEHFFEQKKGRGSLDAGRRTLKRADEIAHIVMHREEGKFSKVVSQSECEANDYNLDAKRYVVSDKQARLEFLLKNNNTVMLGDLVDILRPQHTKDEADTDADTLVSEVSVSDIGDDGYITPPQKKLVLTRSALDRIRQHVLEPHDILLAVKGSVGKVGLVPPEKPETWLANQSFQILRMRPNSAILNPVVLLRYLSSPIAQALIAARTSGTTVRMLQTRDVQSLPVVVPSLEEQEAIADEQETIVALYAQMAQLHAEAVQLAQARWEL